MIFSFRQNDHRYRKGSLGITASRRRALEQHRRVQQLARGSYELPPLRLASVSAHGKRLGARSNVPWSEP